MKALPDVQDAAAWDGSDGPAGVQVGGSPIGSPTGDSTQCHLWRPRGAPSMPLALKATQNLGNGRGTRGVTVTMRGRNPGVLGQAAEEEEEFSLDDIMGEELDE